MILGELLSIIFIGSSSSFSFFSAFGGLFSFFTTLFLFFDYRSLPTAKNAELFPLLFLLSPNAPFNALAAVLCLYQVNRFMLIVAGSDRRMSVCDRSRDCTFLLERLQLVGRADSNMGKDWS